MKKVLFTFILLLSVLVLAPFKNVYAYTSIPPNTNNYPYSALIKNSSAGYDYYSQIYSQNKVTIGSNNIIGVVGGNVSVFSATGTGEFTGPSNMTGGFAVANITTSTVTVISANHDIIKYDGTKFYTYVQPYPTQEQLVNGEFVEGIYFFEPKGSQNFIKGITYNGKIYFDVPITYNTLGIAAPLDTIKDNLITFLNSNLKSKFDFYLKDSSSNIIPMNISIGALNVTTTFNDQDPFTANKYKGYLDFKFSVSNTGNYTIVSKFNAPSELKNSFIPLYQWFTWETVKYKMYETTRDISISENIVDSNNDGKDDTSGNTIVIPPAPTPTPNGNTTTTTETGSGTIVTITNTNNVSSSSSSTGGTGTTQPTIDSAQAVSNFTQVGGYFTAFTGFLGEIISFLPLEVKALIIAAAGIIFVICIKRAILA